MNKKSRKNMAFIKNLNVALHNKIENTKLANTFIDESRNGQKNICKKIDCNNIAIHSRYNPQKQAKFICDYALSDNPDIVFLFGLGLGYEFKEMLKTNNNTRYFIIEPDDEIFKLLVENHDIQYLFNNNNIYFIQDNSYMNIMNFFELMVNNDKTINIKFVILPSYKKMYEELIIKLNTYIGEFINKLRINIRSINMSSRAWCQSSIVNLRYLKTTAPVSILKSSFKDRPAVIVAAGPSLSYNLEKLKELGEEIVIAAVGTGIQILEKNRIKASLVGAIDVWKTEEELFDDIEINKNIALFFSSNTSYNIPNIMEKNKFMMSTGHMDLYISEKLNFGEDGFFSGPSIANTMAYNLSKLGCNPIIFLGQDLCYSDDKSYADGAKDDTRFEKDYFEKNQFIKTKNKNNEDVYTTNTFLAMKASMEHCIKLHPHTTYLNGTKNGLNIEGAENINFNVYANNFKINSEKYSINKLIEQTYEQYLESIESAKIDNFISEIKQDNDEVIDALNNILAFLEGNYEQSEKVKSITNVIKSLEKIEFYNKVIRYITKEIEFTYSSRNFVDKYNQMFSYILDKCLIMDNAFKYEIYGKDK